MARARVHARFDALFAAADKNKDGKLTKDEVASFIWQRLGKTDEQPVTKEDVQKFFRQRIAALRAERPRRGHKPHSNATKPEKTESGSGSGSAQPKPATAPSTPKSEPKAEAKPAAKLAPAQAALLPTAPAATSAPVQAVSPKTSDASKTGKVSQAEIKQSSGPKQIGTKIGTSTTSGEVKAALFAARR